MSKITVALALLALGSSSLVQGRMLSSTSESLGPKCFISDFSEEIVDDCILAESVWSSSAKCQQNTIIKAGSEGSCPDAQKALDKHNAVRAAYGANPMVWSQELAEYAQNVVDTCPSEPTPGMYGENMAIGTALTCEKAVNLWASEASKYPVDGVPGYSVQTGAFTQVVWKDSVEVGCAVKDCPTGTIVACSYKSPGNIIGQFEEQVGMKGDVPECLPSGETEDDVMGTPGPETDVAPAPETEGEDEECCILGLCRPVFCRLRIGRD
eukprot:jgi/Picsp_1/5628/NSC_02987-R1_pr-1 protein